MDFNFTSQICTSRDQSERLLALGLKKETADMHYYHTVDFEGNEVWYPSIIPYVNVVLASDFVGETEICLENNTIPAWSLHRLIEILDIWYLELNFNEFNNAYDQVISYLEERVKGGFINKEYLEK
jgi:hypothetical protein